MYLNLSEQHKKNKPSRISFSHQPTTNHRGFLSATNPPLSRTDGIHKSTHRGFSPFPALTKINTQFRPSRNFPISSTDQSQRKSSHRGFSPFPAPTKINTRVRPSWIFPISSTDQNQHKPSRISPTSSTDQNQHKSDHRDFPPFPALTKINTQVRSSRTSRFPRLTETPKDQTTQDGSTRNRRSQLHWFDTKAFPDRKYKESSLIIANRYQNGSCLVEAVRICRQGWREEGEWVRECCLQYTFYESHFTTVITVHFNWCIHFTRLFISWKSLTVPFQSYF